jgi:hypothetical protein
VQGMTDHPAIMSAPMVMACLREVREPGSGKTETRRLLYSERVAKNGIIPGSATYLQAHRPPICLFGHYWTLTGWQNRKPGDRLWIRENAYFMIDQRTGKPAKTEGYFADGPNPFEDNHTVKARPSIHMPRWASRLTLIVTDVRIERLQDITEASALAEGAPLAQAGQGEHGPIRTYRTGFVRLWGSLHGPQSWLDNPWVVRVAFRPVLANIDSLEAA